MVRGSWDKEQTHAKNVVRKNPWLRKMWSMGQRTEHLFDRYKWKVMTFIEWLFCKRYGMDHSKLFFAYTEEGLIGIDWKDCRYGNDKDACLIQGGWNDDL